MANPDETKEFEKERLLTLINSMADGVIATDENLNIALYNGAALSILDINTSLTDKSLIEVLELYDHRGEKIDLRNLIKELRTTKSFRDYEISYKDQSKINLYINIAPIRLGFGQPGVSGFVLIMRDITREKSLEEERDEFISVASHELRTPIAIAEGNISNASLIAEKSDDKTELLLALKKAHDQINFLSGMINDMATLSRAERGDLKATLDPINVHDIVKKLEELHRPDVTAKGLQIESIVDPELELIYSSQLYVEEILQNLITNAIKYTEAGTITISASKQVNGVLLGVKDTGIGISRQDQEKVFGKFFRSEDFRTRDHKGTGLGLYVSAKLAKLIGGRISVESELNQGSTFSLFIPLVAKAK